MSGILAIDLAGPVSAVTILDGYSGPAIDERTETGTDNEHVLKKELDEQQALFMGACRTLNGVVENLNDFCDKMFSRHREEIAHLAVEIARKILVQKIEKGDYEIESIVKKALENAPGHEDLVVHLHPDDVAQFQAAQEAEPKGELAGIKLVSDSNISRAECLLEGSKGIVKSLINENLERIARALNHG